MTEGTTQQEPLELTPASLAPDKPVQAAKVPPKAE